MRTIGLAVAALLLAAAPARANDSEAQVPLGGLVLTPSANISMDAEDLFVSREQVRVKYRSTNHAATDADVLVAFPLPDRAFAEDEALHDYRKDLKFQTTVDGKPAQLDYVEQATVNGTDVTARLTALGIAIIPSDIDFVEQMKARPDVATLVKEGLLANEGSAEQPYYVPKWQIRTFVTRRQVFPAGKTVAVEHSYVPLVGGSVGGNLNADHRKESWAKEHAAQFCIDDAFNRAFDGRVKAMATANTPSPYSESWVSYVLSSGANWKGPIADFRLVVDKGKAANLVSFCAEGVKKISPTQFEVRKRDFEPSKDLDVLIVEFYKPEG